MIDFGVRLRDYLAERIREVPPEHFPSRAKLMDKVALVRLKEEIEELRHEIGELILQFYNARAVYLVRGVEGIERRPRLELIAGEPVREIMHRECGCVFKLDLTRLMFCLGNSFERLRVAGLTGAGEVVVDMFAGVGQFTIPIAVLGEPEKIYAIEINPIAHQYLLENVRLNGVGDRVEAILGDCRKIVPRMFNGIADRVIMGYFGGTIEALHAALYALKPEGGIIHFHELAERGSEENFVKKVLEAAESHGFHARLMSWRKVKSYSKTRNHIVIDFFAIKA